MKIKIEYLATETLIPYARNSREHSDAQVAQIAGSMREFGFTNPVLIDKEAGILAGHGRVLAALKLGLEQVPCIRLDHLTQAQRRALVIADNKLALNASWDFDMLKVEVEDLAEQKYDIALLGFNQAELNDLIGVPVFQPSDDEQGRLDQKSPTICPSCGHEFAA